MPSEIFVLTQEQAVTSQKADYTYLGYMEVISGDLFFPWDVVLIKKKKDKLIFFLKHGTY